MKKPKKIATIADVDARVEKLAQTTQREFVAIRQEMATKSDTKDILLAIQVIDLHLSAYASRWNEEFEQLEKRVRALEHKTGIR